MVIDVHAHCVPDGLVPALEAGGFASPALEPVLSDLPARLDAMDLMGVDRQIVSPFIGLTSHELDAPAGSRYCGVVNDLMAATVEPVRDRLSALATVPLQSGKAAAEELVRVVSRLGMVGAQIGTDTGRGQLDDDDLEPFWEAAAGLRCLVLIHPNAAARDPQPYLLDYLVGNPADTTLAAARLMFGGVLDRHPDLRICLVHGGGFLPYQIGRLQRGFAAYGDRRGARLTSSPLELLGRFHYDSVLSSPRMIRALVDSVGVERVLLGTDYPYELGDLDPLSTLAGVPGLDDRDRKLVEGGNAEHLLAGIVA